MRGGTATQERLTSPDGIAAPPGDYATWDDYMTDFVRSETVWRDEEAQRGLKAMRLAPNVRVYQALLAGRPVEAGALDPYWRARYRL